MKKAKEVKSCDESRGIVVTVLPIIALILVFVFVGNYFKVNPSGAFDSLDEMRSWPSFQLMEIEEPTLESGMPVSLSPTPIEEGISPADPGLDDISTPYAFVNNASTRLGYFFGPVYYSPGNAPPELIYSGNCATVALSGDFIFCINVDALSEDAKPIPIRTTPIKIDITKPDGSVGQVTTLNDSRNCPTMWNFLEPINDGDDYLYGAMNSDRDDDEYLTGPIVLVRDGDVYLEVTESALHATFSPDGNKIAFVSKRHPRKDWGNGDLFVYDIAEETTRRVYDAASNEECMSVAPSKFFEAFTVAKKSSSGVWSQWVELSGLIDDIDMHQILGDAYNWNGNIKVSDTGAGIIWEAKKTRSNTRGYNLLAANIVLEAAPNAFELFTYDNSKRRRMPDIDNEGFVIFSNWLEDGPMPYAIYGARAFEGTSMFHISDPGPDVMNLGATFQTQ